MSGADKPITPDLTALPGDALPGLASERETHALIGADAIREVWKRLPGKPGVYRMIGEDGEVLYVGKAKSLKNRVASYAQGRGHSNRILRMIAQTRTMEIIVTATETEALLLETNMIKRLRPRFNVLMRDDKSFPLIAIRMDHAAPALQKHRGARTFKGKFYGPFASAGAVNRTLNTLQKAFLLRSCSDSVYSARTRPCLLFQIKRCAAPCVDLIDTHEYGQLVSDAVDFLEGRSSALQKRLADDMQAASDALEFENAARLRNRIRALAAVRAAQGINPSTFTEADVFALYREGGQSCVQVFFFRAGQNWGNRAYFPRHDSEDSDADILSALLAQFYDDQPPPPLVLANLEPNDCAVLQQALSLKAGRNVEIRAPQRGEKKEIVDQAVLNAREAFGRRLAETGNVAKLLDGVAETFGLAQRPERIEIYDNSHIQGTNALGAMVVAGPEGFIKTQYRKFNMKTEEFGGDDFAMMKAMIRRRFARMLSERDGERTAAPSSAAPDLDRGRVTDGGVDFSKERDDDRSESKFAAWPDLVLIDGGEGQVNAALEALRELGLEGRLKIVGVAKGVDRDAGRERFILPGRAPFRLEEKSPVLYYLQRLRDEAHRFAIGAHRAKRKAEAGRNPLDDIDGVGPARKKALLGRFGSARGVSRAALSELEEVEGVNFELAKRIHAFFNEKE